MVKQNIFFYSQNTKMWLKLFIATSTGLFRLKVSSRKNHFGFMFKALTAFSKEELNYSATLWLLEKILSFLFKEFFVHLLVLSEKIITAVFQNLVVSVMFLMSRFSSQDFSLVVHACLEH